ncbi:MAG: amidophosphoribosyltransferase [Lachnospiraceae bacterium]|nr:amidophosphoribosyltransferase [Lachnospiraceae bacterium]
MDELREECGVFGVWREPGAECAIDIYHGLLSLQHRGQESAGIAVCDTAGERGNMSLHKDMGLVSEVFDEDTLGMLKGNIGVGHVRYSTTGDSTVRNAQPIAFQYMKGTLALVHNGNIVNTSDVKHDLLMDGSVFHATSDSEVIATLIAKIRARTGSIEEAVREAVPLLAGGYAIIIMSPRKIIAVRDPLGLKPLCIGQLDDGYVISSESCALSAVGARFMRDIAPGEIVTVSRHGLKSDTGLCSGADRHAHCIFEYIYFARLDSVMDGVGIYESRYRGGRALAAAHPADADIVTGVPESGLTAAEGYAAQLGLPFVRVFHKNSYIGRTFIKPTDSERKSAVSMKLGVIPGSVTGRRVVLIDDSIVRGTTISNLISMLREAGATEVHVRISSPPFLYPCYYGTDVPDNSQLIANHHSVEEIRQQTGADSLAYMRLEDLRSMTGDLGLCRACFDGDYPTQVLSDGEQDTGRKGDIL